MSWIPAAQYEALIGGILYRNVAQPIVCNGKQIIFVARNIETGHLGISLELFQQDRSPIACVTNNAVTLHNAADYVALGGRNRTSVVHKESGRIWFDLKCTPGGREYELSVSCLLFSESGYPIILHPDRSKFGVANDNKAPNISMITLTTQPGNSAGAIGLDNGALYLLGMAIENYRIGVEIMHSADNAAN